MLSSIYRSCQRSLPSSLGIGSFSKMVHIHIAEYGAPLVDDD